MVNSRIEGFYKLSREERLKEIAERCNLNEDETELLGDPGAFDMNVLENMIENVIGVMPFPLGIATNFTVNGKDYLVPMVIEEPSVVAAASNAAKGARETGGFKATATDPVMIGQIQISKVADPDAAIKSIQDDKRRLIEEANSVDPMLVRLKGGAKDIIVRKVQSRTGTMVVVHILVDVRDAMGANAVNSMAEHLAHLLEEMTGGKVFLRILSNLAMHRLARSSAMWTKEFLGGEGVVDGIIEAFSFAEADIYRCATHNKGVMNGIIAVALATGNDTRALESGAHSYASAHGGYEPLTRWRKDEEGNLVGAIELPMAVGLIGGATKSHPIARTNLKILDVESATELGMVMASVGLAQNLAAMRALADEGIQSGHMKLHARNIAIGAGAPPELVDEVTRRMIEERKIRMDRAKEIVDELSRKGDS
ncbi:MAG TPA: hydroxymethylglutaryl-CoA reductase, degradative [Euryarchaeota archaeon]|nr:hydroxymethylglutaryl-CoA reductase, degradative [Euryarchaeota archaeon]